MGKTVSRCSHEIKATRGVPRKYMVPAFAYSRNLTLLLLNEIPESAPPTIIRHGSVSNWGKRACQKELAKAKVKRYFLQVAEL